MKRFAALILLLLLVPALACQGASAPADAQQTTPEPIAPREPTPAPTATPEMLVFAGGAAYPLGAAEIATPIAAGDEALLDRLTQLSRADVSGSADYALVKAYFDARPEVEVRFSETVGGVTFTEGAESLDLSAVPLSELPRVLELLPMMPQLSAVRIAGHTAKGADALAYENGTLAPAASGTFGSALDWQQLGQLQAVRPDIRYDYAFTYLDQTYSAADAQIDLSGISVTEAQLEELRALGAHLSPDCMFLMERCGVDNERMAALRDALPHMKVVWRVSFGKASARTDAKRIRLVKDGSIYSTKELSTLKYCTEVELLDIGHNKIRNIDFVQYMPKLRVAILAIGYIKDISPLAACTELEYCELFTNWISDLTPLSGLQKLRHLDLTYNRITDPTPLYALHDLERLWIGRTKFTDEQKQALQEAMPNCEINYGHNPTGDGWRDHPRYTQLFEEFGYDRPKNGEY